MLQGPLPRLAVPALPFAVPQVAVPLLAVLRRAARLAVPALAGLSVPGLAVPVLAVTRLALGLAVPVLAVTRLALGLTIQAPRRTLARGRRGSPRRGVEEPELEEEAGTERVVLLALVPLEERPVVRARLVGVAPVARRK